MINDSGCLSCRFYRPMNANLQDGGVCRRHAPTGQSGSDRYRGWPRVYPAVDVGDFCGEHELARASSPPKLKRKPTDAEEVADLVALLSETRQRHGLGQAI